MNMKEYEEQLNQLGLAINEVVKSMLNNKCDFTLILSTDDIPLTLLSSIKGDDKIEDLLKETVENRDRNTGEKDANSQQS